MNYMKKFPFDTVKGVDAYLRNRHYVQSAAANGDYIAVDLEADFKTVFDKTEISPHQRTLLHLIYECGLTQKEVGKLLGTTQQAVQQQSIPVLKRIATEFKKTYKGGR